MSACTVSHHFTSVLTEYGLSSFIVADFGSQFVSEKFKSECKQSGITLAFSSPYHHQANSLAEKTIGTCKSTCHLITYELLFSRRPKHPNKDCHQEANLRKQTKQPAFYNTKTNPDKPAFSRNQLVYVWNSLKYIWEPDKVFNLPNPGTEPRTYLVEMQGKIYRRTREHLRPRVTPAPHKSARECVPLTNVHKLLRIQFERLMSSVIGFVITVDWLCCDANCQALLGGDDIVLSGKRCVVSSICVSWRLK